MATGLLRPSGVLWLLANPGQGSDTARMIFMINLHELLAPIGNPCPPLCQSHKLPTEAGMTFLA